MWFLVLQRTLVEFFLDFLCFPLWWYSGGAKKVLFFCGRLVRDGNLRLAPFLWLKNMFVPMYNQRDFAGRLLSVFMRFWNVIARGLALLLYTVAVFGIFILYLIWPVFIIYMLFI